ncbi:hypothetical protein J3Q64DRAFT_1713897 [Phycomyces blakesleeanus]|uniref:Secreted protein n=1 Tax=Phycomyces blakesleeanus TaxID=4837 RepID=A0ABR3BJ58_PHYBL
MISIKVTRIILSLSPFFPLCIHSGDLAGRCCWSMCARIDVRIDVCSCVWFGRIRSTLNLVTLYLDINSLTKIKQLL